jgi:2-polyprenyl-3-methyl-5-hydroxy-6-metoxy-1,4-benzoquinol methylase
MDPYKTTFETWNKIASLYQEKFMDLDLYDDTYDIFCKKINGSDPKVLEIGCGPGNITKYIRSKRTDLKIDALDVSPNMITLAKANNPDVNFQIMDCREIDQLNGKYDAIIIGFCIPYLSKEDCSKLIRDCSSLLNDKGILYFSTIEGNYNDSGYEFGSSGDRSFVYYYDEKYLSGKLHENNFELTDLIRKNYSKSAEAISTHLIFIGEKK